MKALSSVLSGNLSLSSQPPSDFTITFPPPLSPHLTFVPVQSQPATKLLPATHLQAVSRNGAVQAWSQCLKYTTTCQNSSFTTSCASPLRCLRQVMTSSSSSFLFDFLVALMTSGVRGQKDWRDHWKAAITCGDHQGLYYSISDWTTCSIM